MTEEQEKWAEHLAATEPEGPEAGHPFVISVSMGASYRVGDGPHVDSPEISDPLVPVTVRAWNLRDALHKAADLPMSRYFLPEEDMTPEEFDEAMEHGTPVEIVTSREEYERREGDA